MKTLYKIVRIIALFSCAVMACLFNSTAIRSQTPDQVEKTIANLPPEQRAYERFRFWVTTQPPDEQRGPNLDALPRLSLSFE